MNTVDSGDTGGHYRRSRTNSRMFLEWNNSSIWIKHESNSSVHPKKRPRDGSRVHRSTFPGHTNVQIVVLESPTTLFHQSRESTKTSTRVYPEGSQYERTLLKENSDVKIKSVSLYRTPGSQIGFLLSNYRYSFRGKFSIIQSKVDFW